MNSRNKSRNNSADTDPSVGNQTTDIKLQSLGEEVDRKGKGLRRKTTESENTSQRRYSDQRSNNSQGILFENVDNKVTNPDSNGGRHYLGNRHDRHNIHKYIDNEREMFRSHSDSVNEWQDRNQTSTASTNHNFIRNKSHTFNDAILQTSSSFLVFINRKQSEEIF